MEKPRESGMTKIVGVDPETEKSLLDIFKRRFEREEKHPLEKEHSPELDELIAGVNEKLEKFLQRFGIKSVSIAPSNIHLIDKSQLPTELTSKPELEFARGFYSPETQQIVVLFEYEKHRLQFAHILAHEMLHLNSFVSYQKSSGEEYTTTRSEDGEIISKESFSLRDRRIGLRINSPTKGITHFYDFDEALVEELAIRFDWDYFSTLPMLHEQFEERQIAVERSVKELGRDLEKEKRMIGQITSERTETGWIASVDKPSYSKERGKLYELISDLYEKNKDSFQTEEEVFALFVTAGFKGRILPLARLIESTCGKGSFRKLGEETGKQKGPRGQES